MLDCLLSGPLLPISPEEPPSYQFLPASHFPLCSSPALRNPQDLRAVDTKARKSLRLSAPPTHTTQGTEPEPRGARGDGREKGAFERR